MSLDARNVELFPYLPYLLKDIWEIGTSTEHIIQLLERQKRNFANPDLCVLDLGCGKGAASISLAQKFGYKVLGIDAIPEFIQLAQEKAQELGLNDRCRFEVDDIREYVLKSDLFDIVILGSIGPVLGNIEKTLRTLTKCLRPDGVIVLDDAYIPDGSEFFHNGYLPEAQFVQQIRHSGFTIKDSIRYSSLEVAKANAGHYSRIKQRATELISMYPGLRYIFDDYLKNQRHENDVLENHVSCVLMLIERNNDVNENQ